MLLVASAAVGLSGVAAGSAFAFHSGHEYLANGRGTTDVSTDQTTTEQRCIIFVACATITTRVQSTTRERFSFGAKQGALALGALPEPHGTMTVDYALTRTTTVTVTDPSNICSLVACPPQSTTTTGQTATATANVTCLTVVNNRAALGGRVTKFKGSFPPPRGLVFNVADNTIAKQQVAPDEFAAAFVAEAPQVCPAPTPGHPLTSGDITVEER
jgi:hypothetical protein